MKTYKRKWCQENTVQRQLKPTFTIIKIFFNLPEEVPKVKEGDIKNYLFHLVEEKKVATSTLNSAINALQFYYGIIPKKKFLCETKRQGRAKVVHGEYRRHLK